MGEGANQMENEPENLFQIVLHTTVVLQWVQRECSFPLILRPNNLFY